MGNYLDRLQSRRTALKLLGIGGISAASLLTLPRLMRGRQALSKSKFTSIGLDDFLRDSGPIDRLPHAVGERVFSGDKFERPHSILWDKVGYMARKNFVPSLEKTTEEAPLVIVGGGVSGLFMAYLLSDQQPIVLEQAARFGGNSKGENHEGLDYSLGAAYFTVPDEGTPDLKLLRETGMDKLWTVKTEEDPCVVNGKIYQKFWEGDSAPSHRAQFVRLNKYFMDVCLEKNGHVFPEIPITSAETRPMINKLDGQTFLEHAREVAGGELHPHIVTALEQYSWSSFGASSNDISAAMGLNFYAGEFGPVAVAAGGNSAFAEQALKKIAEKVPLDRLRTGAIVFDVRREGEHTLVSYENAQGEIESIRARAVVMACPKFVVKRVVHDLEPSRMEAINKLQYNSYLVANVLLKKRVDHDRYYDLFMLGNGKTNAKDPRASATARKVTDVVLADYAKGSASKSVLSLYRAFPYQGSRAELFAPTSYDQFRAEFEKQITDEILPTLGLYRGDVADLRLTRWGHPMPVAAKGLIADGTIDAIRKPFKESVFFVEQDNWMLPAFETALGEAIAWAPEVRKVLG